MRYSTYLFIVLLLCLCIDTFVNTAPVKSKNVTRSVTIRKRLFGFGKGSKSNSGSNSKSSSGKSSKASSAKSSKAKSSKASSAKSSKVKSSKASSAKSSKVKSSKVSSAKTSKVKSSKVSSVKSSKTGSVKSSSTKSSNSSPTNTYYLVYCVRQDCHVVTKTKEPKTSKPSSTSNAVKSTKISSSSGSSRISSSSGPKTTTTTTRKTSITFTTTRKTLITTKKATTTTTTKKATTTTTTTKKASITTTTTKKATTTTTTTTTTTKKATTTTTTTKKSTTSTTTKNSTTSTTTKNSISTQTPIIIEATPLKQKNYPVKYDGNCLISEYGCCITSITMALNQIEKKNYTPVDVAKLITFENCLVSINSYAKLGFSIIEKPSLRDILEGLKKGNLVPFGANGTSGSHWVAVYAYIGDYKELKCSDFLIHDPGRDRTTLCDLFADYRNPHRALIYNK